MTVTRRWGFSDGWSTAGRWRAMPVEGYPAQEVSAGQHDGGTCSGGEPGAQGVEDHVALTGLGNQRLTRAIQLFRYGGSGGRMGDAWAVWVVRVPDRCVPSGSRQRARMLAAGAAVRPATGPG
jgi:hypothetical protein